MSLLPGSLWVRLVVLVKVLSISQIELFNYLLYLKPLPLPLKPFNKWVLARLKIMLLFVYKSYVFHLFIYVYIYIYIYIYKHKWALDNLQGLYAMKHNPPTHIHTHAHTFHEIKGTIYIYIYIYIYICIYIDKKHCHTLNACFN